MKVTKKEERVMDRVRTAARIAPSDTSDTISDRPDEPDTDTDRFYTGERATIGPDPHAELNVEFDADRVVDAKQAGLGGGLDQAEEAQLGVTDEELEQEKEKEKGKAPSALSDLVKKPKP